MKKSIFVLGNLTGAYRIDNYVRAFLELGYKNIYINNFSSNKMIRFIVNVLMMIISDIVFVPPLQHNNRLIKLAFLLKKKVIIDFYISYFDSNVFDYKKVSENSSTAKSLKRIDIIAIQNSSAVIFLSDSEKVFYCNQLGISSQNKNAFVLPLVVPEKKDFAKLDFFNNNSDILNICWVGTYIPLHGLENIIKALKILVEKNYKVHLYLWGDSEQKAQPYMELCSDLNIMKEVTFINSKWGNTEEWEDFIINKCDLSLGVFGSSEKAKTVLPNKVLDGISFKTPVLTQYSLGVSEYFKDNADIFLCNNDDISISRRIIDIIELPEEQIFDIVDIAYKKYKKNFDYYSFKTKVKKIFEDNIMR